MKSVQLGGKWICFDGNCSVTAKIGDGLAFAMKSEGMEVKMVGQFMKDWMRVTFALKSNKIGEETKNLNGKISEKERK